MFKTTIRGLAATLALTGAAFVLTACDGQGSGADAETIAKLTSEIKEQQRLSKALMDRLDRIEQRVVHALEEVGLDASFRFRYPHQISGGQRQRVSVARALITDPEIVLLDEPTSALDVSVQAEVLNLLMRLKREHGLTYVLVSHNLAVIAHMCERLSVMQNGRIVETMGVDQLREREPEKAYTRQLLTASLGYDRAAIDAFEEFA